MQYLAAVALSALLAVNGAILALASGQLPARVASHFNGQGFAIAFMSRDNYLLLMTALGLGLPILVVLILVALPRLVPTRLRIPSRDYWIAPERRSETLVTVTTSGLVIACFLSVFMLAVHLLVVQANTRTPPQLDTALLYTLIALLIIAILGWQLILWRRFQFPR